MLYRTVYKPCCVVDPLNNHFYYVNLYFLANLFFKISIMGQFFALAITCVFQKTQNFDY